MNDSVLVSVICLTYNHVEYIRDALEGFVKQKTNFRYEVIVHDDASTDGTAEIVKAYAKMYPELIRPILQPQNLHSQGIKIGREILYPLARGKYIASCEGDDFWCDDFKLQKQVDFLESNNEYVACVHNTERIDCRTGKTNIMYNTNHCIDIKLTDVIGGGGAMYQTSSLMTRKEYYLLPIELTAKTFGDYPKSLYLVLSGKVYYMNEVMSVYRYFAKGSWTSKHTSDHNKTIEVYMDTIGLLKRFDYFYNYRFTDIFSRAIMLNTVKLKYHSGCYKEIIGNKQMFLTFRSEYGLLKTMYLLAKAFVSK